MTDDRSLERAARSWLEIGPTEAPERPVQDALRLIDTTPQERDWHVPWRLPRMTTPVRFAVAAIVGLFVIGGAFYAFAPGGPGVGASPSIIASAAPTPLTTEAYRAARDALCIAARFPAAQQRPWLLQVWDGSITDKQRADWVDALRTYADLYEGLISDLDALVPPADLAEGHATNVADFREVRGLIVSTADRLEAGEDAQAKVSDESTDPIGRRMEQWEDANDLARCP